MARQGIFDTSAVPTGWFDVCGQDQGWFDRDLLFYPATQPAPPWYASLLYQGGWDETADHFTAYVQDSAAMANLASAERLLWHLDGGEDAVFGKTLFGVPDPELEARVAEELGMGAYGRQVSFKDFEDKILSAQRALVRREEFRQTVETIAAESAEERRMQLLVRRTITVAGVTYFVWKIAMWL
jgi:hypothetical protein